MAYLNKITKSDRNTLKRALCLHGQILSPIKQNEEILQIFPHFSLFSILYSPDSLQHSMGAIRFKAAKMTRF